MNSCALAVDDEILYNSYDTSSIRRSLQDDMLRNNITDYSGEFFDKLLDRKERFKVIIYEVDHKFTIVYYNPVNNSLTMEYYSGAPQSQTQEQTVLL
jgi:hypothetical protein